MSPIALPNPVTIAFVGYWLAPVDTLAETLIALAPQRFKRSGERWLIRLNLAIMSAGLGVWVAALAGLLHEAGVFLPTRATWLKFFLGTSGLVLFVATLACVVIERFGRRELPADRWLRAAGGIGALLGLLIWVLK